MKNNLSAALAGFIFAIGLGISGMTRPEKVIGFLDVFGHWDISLMFVMLSSIAIHFVLYRIIRKRKTPLFSDQWFVPNKTEITRSLIIGSILFGIGWGLAGYCPGPAVVSLISGRAQPILFCVMMLIGMYIQKLRSKA